ncbi:hypothetical protein OAX78_01575 [Planctomycetota bacterium]|nr:hypothetical protein [Planctomycetota bacterium]
MHAIALGEWIADDTVSGLRYQSYTHEDPFLRAWVNLAPHLKAGPELERMQAVFAERCGKCHLNAELPAADRVAWASLPAEPDPARRLTHFAHEPHLALKSDCTACHVVPEEQLARDALDFQLTPHWRPKSGCMECHTPQKIRRACQTCHDYH